MRVKLPEDRGRIGGNMGLFGIGLSFDAFVDLYSGYRIFGRSPHYLVIGVYCLFL